MRKSLSLRWRLVLLSWSLAFGTAAVLAVLLYLRAERHLLQQLEKTLETKCDEVITILESGGSPSVLADFLVVETKYRFTPYTYFYDIRDGEGRTLAKSENLGSLALPLPEAWREGLAVQLRTEPHPISPGAERVRVRIERVEVARPGGEPAPVVIQTAVSLGPFEAAVRRTLREALLVAAGSLAGVFFLLWFVTTRSLMPVAAMTRKASQITATNLPERLPLAGRADELDELANVLNCMLERLGRSLQMMERFSSDAAHQLRTPLTRIRGEIDLILRSEVADPPRSQLERVQEELERLTRLCSRLLLLSRLDQQAADNTLFGEEVDLEEVAAELLEQMAPLAQDRGVGLRPGTTAPLRVRGNRPLLVEALLNLLDNAIRCTPQGGTVAISIDAMDGVVRLSVEDTGPGVPPEERERIFQRFYHVPRASPAATDDGSGLGLAIVKGISQAHGGRVEVAEAPGGGSVFRIVLPAQPRGPRGRSHQVLISPSRSTNPS
ncbi:MAG TPA: ATP-binding protein [Vicinamibacteria bacterium]|nr:ATP-binding protein [Vicinamibacteria bacterium]